METLRPWWEISLRMERFFKVSMVRANNTHENWSSTGDWAPQEVARGLNDPSSAGSTFADEDLIARESSTCPNPCNKEKAHHCLGSYP